MYNNQEITRKMYEEFLVELTVAFEFDYIDLKTTDELFTFIRDIQECLKKKSTRKELYMGDTYVASKGAKYSKKATIEGFNDYFSKLYIGLLMSIPGVSENKAIAIAKKYQSLRQLSVQYSRRDISHAEKKKLLCSIDIPSSIGDGKSQNIGKKISEKIYESWS